MVAGVGFERATFRLWEQRAGALALALPFMQPRKSQTVAASSTAGRHGICQAERPSFEGD